MAVKTPVKATFDGSNVNGLAEFASGDFVGVAAGGSGAVTFSAGILKADGTNAFTTVSAPSGAIVGISDSQTLTNKTISGSSNTLSNIGNSSLSNSTITVSADSGSNNALDLGDTFTISGGEGIDTSVSGDEITIAGEEASTSNKGVASFSSDNFSVSSGAVTIKDGGIANAELAGSIANSKLANSSITVTDGSTSTATALGGTITFSAGEGMDVGESSGTITFSGEDATTSNKGIASFSSDDFAVSSGAVTVKAGGITNTQLAGSIANSKLANSSITINGSAVALGGSATIASGGSLTSGAFSNLVNFSSDYTVTTDADRSTVLFGSDFNISSTAVFDIDGDGVLEFITSGGGSISDVSITFGDESSNTTDISHNGELSFVGGANIDTAINQNLMTVSVPKALNGPIAGNTLTDTSNSGNITLDFDTYQNFVLTLTGNITLVNPSTESVGQSGVLILIQDGTGSRTLSLGTDYETASSAGITLSTAASAVDLVPYFVKASGSIQLGAVQQAFG